MTNHSVELASIYIIVLSAFGSSMLPTTCYKAPIMADDGGARWPEIASRRQRLKLGGFCYGHGDEVNYGGGFIIHDWSWSEKGRKKC